VLVVVALVCPGVCCLCYVYSYSFVAPEACVVLYFLACCTFLILHLNDSEPDCLVKLSRPNKAWWAAGTATSCVVAVQALRLHPMCFALYYLVGCSLVAAEQSRPSL
jgi:hypothetical protein